MKLQVNGSQYTNFTSAQCSLRLDTLSNTFTFTAVAAEGVPLPFQGGEACKVLVDDEVVLTGFIEVVDVSYSANNHTIVVAGRDKTGDLLDSTLDSISDLRSPITLAEICQKVVDQIGLDVAVIDQASPEPFTGVEDIVSPEIGENAFRFIEKYAKKRQVLLTSNADGNLVITKNLGTPSNGAVQHIQGASDNNVLESSFSYDTTGRFNLYKFGSQMNLVALNQAGATGLDSVVEQSGEGLDNVIRAGRQLVLVSESPYSDTNNVLRAEWERDVRTARGLAYSAMVRGYQLGGGSGGLWELNTLYQINDDFIGKSEPMLCNSVVFNLDLTEGSTTSLGFVDELAYTLQTQKPKTSQSNDLGGAGASIADIIGAL